MRYPSHRPATSRRLGALLTITLLSLATTRALANPTAPGSDATIATPRYHSPSLLFAENLARQATPIPGRLILPEHALESLPSLFSIDALGCHLDRKLGLAPFVLLACDPNTPLQDLIARFEAHGIWAEADFIEQQEDEDTFDPVRDYDLDDAQWHHDNRGQVIDEIAGIPGADIRTPLAWEIVRGSAPAPMVAVIDAGIAPDHVDLRDLLHKNPNETCGDGVDDDNNGYIDDCYGWDVGDQDPDPDPNTLPEKKSSGSTCKSWHGTFMAGIIAARGDNGVGTAGVSWGSPLLNIKKHDDESCVSSTSDSIEAVAYAHAMGARILLLSFSSTAYSTNFFTTLSTADRAGALFVMSAGNSAEDVDTSERFPVYYPLRHKLVVANSTNRDELSGSSNWGSERVDLAAPGNDLIATEPDGSWGTHSGTSYSVPLVGGAAALVMAAYPDLSTKQVLESILDGVHPIPSLDCQSSQECVASGGRLDVFGALGQAAERVGAARLIIEDLQLHDEDMDGELTPGERVRVSWTARNVGVKTGVLSARLDVLSPDVPLDFLQETAAIPAVGFGERFVANAEPHELLFRVSPECERDAETLATFTLRDSNAGLWAAEIAIEVSCQVDLDGDGQARPEDCDDSRPDIFNGAMELCDGVDNDCDTFIDEPESADATTYYYDEDGDGVGIEDVLVTACVAPDDFVSTAGDCDDSDPDVFPEEDPDGVVRCSTLDDGGSSRAGVGEDPFLCASARIAPTSRHPILFSLLLLLTIRRRRRASSSLSKEVHAP